jgi:tRNA A-37 threonylcarbamoyl transferase component Bud32
MRSTDWLITPAFQHHAIAADIQSLDAVFAIEGEPITSDPISSVEKISRPAGTFYLKRYHRAGKWLRRFVGRSRIRAEWENLQLFETLGIPTAKIVGYGEQRVLGSFVRGALITEELPGTADLAVLAEERSPLLKTPSWLEKVSQQVADYTRRMHQHRFAHVDLKWRNILVTDDGAVFFIDCPAGHRPASWRLRRSIIKDLACLDKVARKVLTRSQRLRFYKTYANCTKLGKEDKKTINRVLRFFNKD